MKFLEKLMHQRAVSRLAEEEIYKAVLDEIERGEQRKGLWAKALANCDGDENKARSLYIQYRMQSLSDEATVMGAIAKEVAIDMQSSTSRRKPRPPNTDRSGKDYRTYGSYRDPRYPRRACIKCGKIIEKHVVYCFACGTMNDNLEPESSGG
jgi:hypothetical protein